jgi:hypothetical protein
VVVLLICIPVFIVRGISRMKKAILRAKSKKEINLETRSVSESWGKKKLTGWKAKVKSWFVKDDDEDDHNTIVCRRLYAIFAILIICFSAAIVIPVTYLQQSGGKTYSLQDSFGPYVGTSTLDAVTYNSSFEANGSWSDCFDVPFVGDRYGFFQFWWEMNKNRPIEWLAVL